MKMSNCTFRRPHDVDEVLVDEADVRADALMLAARTGCDPRTCIRALVLGVEALRVRKHRRRIADAARDLNLTLGRKVAS